ncbi:hypothetical protein SAY86_007303 [Trapa natans]|uniref:Uncharacterized protein n=1 Tax=Trapa natans TaxID=22666 RepID=A0AAN7QWV4_TRANT|nr:hypothetical protein SAY86_007303 [Trapa natans]
MMIASPSSPHSHMPSKLFSSIAICGPFLPLTTPSGSGTELDLDSCGLFVMTHVLVLMLVKNWTDFIVLYKGSGHHFLLEKTEEIKRTVDETSHLLNSYLMLCGNMEACGIWNNQATIDTTLSSRYNNGYIEF